MTLLMRDQENREEGRVEGREEGEARLAELINRLSADHRSADILKATTDKTYRQKLYKEYNIE